MSSLIVPDDLPPAAAQLDRRVGRLPRRVPDTILRIVFPLYTLVDHRIVLHSTKAHEDDIRKQISRLRSIQDGWLDGTGKACHPTGLANLAEQLVSYYPCDAPELRLYPTADGSVQAEWWIGNYNAVLEVFLDTASAEWSDYHLQTKVERVRQVKINDKQDWEWVVQRLQSLG